MDVTFQTISNFERCYVELFTRAKNAIETAQQRSENIHRQAFEKTEMIGLEMFTNYAISYFPNANDVFRLLTFSK